MSLDGLVIGEGRDFQEIKFHLKHDLTFHIEDLLIGIG